MFVGVPRMEPFRKATIPKLMAVEVEAGCMSLGIMGKKHVEGLLDFDADFFIPDDIHKPERREKYTGPSILIPVLEKAADTVRQIIRPLYNDSDVARNGYIASYNRSKGGFDWQTTIGQWFLPNIPGSTIDYADQTKWILGNCTHDVHNTLGVDIPSESVLQMPAACAFLNLRGSYLESGTIYQAHTQMVCATTTSVNMVSATIESNVNNSLTVEYNRLPSNIHITRASYFDIIEDRPTPGDRTFGNFPVQHRFTLSDSSNSSSLQHYIYQNHVFTASSNTLSSGSGNAGGVIPMVGAAMIGVSGTDDGSLTLVNSKYFSTQNFSTAVVTRMLGTIGASYLFNSVGYNAWAALDKESFQVEITGGKSAVCYNPPYGAAFLPLTLSAIIVLLWSLQMMISSKLRGTKKWEDMYGGMAPTIVAPTPEKPSQQEVLAWEGVGTRPHLRPVYAQSFGPQTPSSMMPMPMHYPSETEMLVKSSKTDYLG